MNIAMRTLSFLVFKSGNTQLELTLDRFESAVELWLQGNHAGSVKEFNRISNVYRDRRMGNLNKKPLAYGYDRCQYYNSLESTKERLDSIDRFVIDNRDKPMTKEESSHLLRRIVIVTTTRERNNNSWTNFMEESYLSENF